MQNKFQKLILCLCIIIGSTAWSNAQVGVGTQSPNPSAVLDLSSTNKGLLIPRMSSTAKTAIDNPAKGLLVHDTTLNQIQLFDGSAWQSLANAEGTWTISGNALSANGQAFIGSTNNQPVIFRVNNTEVFRLNTDGTISVNGKKMIKYLTPTISTNIIGRSTFNNIGLGQRALDSVSSGNGNVAIGDSSMVRLKTGWFNVAVGERALSANNGDDNVAVGYQALENATSSSNVAINTSALNQLTTGWRNVAVGQQSMERLTIGSHNVAMGILAGRSLVTGEGNISIGAWSNTNADTFSGYRVAFGFGANANGNQSMSIGQSALSRTSGSIAIGANAIADSLNSVAIGVNARASRNNAIVLGQTGTNQARVAIGTSAPNSSSILELNSTSMGFLPPRMTMVQMSAIVSPAEGLTLYCIDCSPKGLRVFDSVAWSDIMGNRAPVNTVSPTITSSANTFTTGTSITLTVNNGTWIGNPTSFSYQWLRNGVAISGQTSNTYTSAIAEGAYTCIVSASNAIGIGSRTSSSFLVSTVVPANTARPTISTSHYILSVNTGSWTNANIFSYQWMMNGATISGATSATYAVPIAYYNNSFHCMVTANNNMGTTTVSSDTLLLNYVLNRLSYTPPAIYSLRKLTASATNAITVRRSSDNTTQNIGFDAFGNLDTTALKTFVGSDSGYVSVWFDQSGNGRHGANATAAEQPFIMRGGMIEQINGRPSIRFDGVNDNLVITNGLPSVATPSGIAVLEVIGNGGNGLGRILGTSAVWIANLTQEGYTQFNPYTSDNTTLTKRIVGFNVSGTTADMYRNGVMVRVGTGAVSGNAGGNPMHIGNQIGLNRSYNGRMSEIVLPWQTLSNTERIAIEQNQGAYFNISVQ